MKPTTYYIIKNQLENRLATLSDLIATHLEIVIEFEEGTDISPEYVEKAKQKIKEYTAKRNEVKEAMIDFDECVYGNETEEI